MGLLDDLDRIVRSRSEPRATFTIEASHLLDGQEEEKE